ncbi:conserved hypothetical protein [Chloroherpeton thalassium ATCC 35110]|uniref:Uncharacterized protein n=1 Tax=Chloroherpeton thalassium (strain ATCC 35110 / GB-78) TaxID=517418 RepID=B3QVP2_CHLT3|nr:hypothetical protein [Chloroherpeton thalassium]ACF13099.1 conserved hypothetical protein [Chloroherpeton thalassium ATCC 35110]
MSEVYSYPITYPEFWLGSYAFFSWALGMFVLAAAWAVFFRFGQFKYGIDMGCLVKTALILFFTMISLGLPMQYNIKFQAEHAHEGDMITLTDKTLEYVFREGGKKLFKLDDIFQIYQEPITYNPPIKYIVKAKTESGIDSIFVRKNLPDFRSFMKKLTEKTGLKVQRSL